MHRNMYTRDGLFLAALALASLRPLPLFLPLLLLTFPFFFFLLSQHAEPQTCPAVYYNYL